MILGIGISPHKTDGVLRFEHFCQMLDLPYKIVGEGKIWRGGMENGTIGGGQKIIEALEIIRNMDNKLIIICDTYDIVPVARMAEILEKYITICRKNNVFRIVASSEVGCWPDKSLANSYPEVDTKYKYLNSGAIMGYRDDIYQILSKTSIGDADDDQLYLTKEFLSGSNIILDYQCELFQTLYMVEDDIVIRGNRIYNKYTNSYPSFIHGNWISKLFLNYIESYIEPNIFINHAFTIENYKLKDPLPKIFFALYVDSGDRANFKLFMDKVFELNYANRKIFIYDKIENSKIGDMIINKEFTYRPYVTKYIFEDFLNTECDYYFLLEQKCILTRKNLLHELVSLCGKNRRIVTPLLVAKSDNYANFREIFDGEKSYWKPGDYLDIVTYNKVGCWNVPCVSGAMLIRRDVISHWNLEAENKFGLVDRCMALCYNLRKFTLFIYVVNFHEYGYLNDS
ncbi:MAG: hypothetical protein QW303_02725 [Nitrososphaerota archaeon]